MFAEILDDKNDMTWDADHKGDSDSGETFSLLFGNTSLFDMGDYYKTNKLNLSEGFLYPVSL